MQYQYTIKVVDTPEVLAQLRTRVKWFQNRGQIIPDGDGLILNFDADLDGWVEFLTKKYPNAIITVLNSDVV